jgi:ssDNA-binding replication factor A large subunit
MTQVMNHGPGLHWPTPANRIENLRPNTPVKGLEVVVLRMYPQRMIASSSYTGPVAAGCGRDETGLVGLVFWAEQINQVNVGDVVRINTGWCRSRDGALVVSTGKHGTLSIVQRFEA